MPSPAGTAAANGMRNPRMFLEHLWRPITALYGHFAAYHEYGPPRLKYMGWVGVFTFTSFYFLRFTRPSYELLDDIEFRVVAVLLMLFMALKDLWPRRLQRYYLPYTYVTLTVCLPFFCAYTGFLRGGGAPSISNCFLAICFLTLLADWRNIVAMTLAGAGAAVLLFKITAPGEEIPADMIARLPAFLLIAAGGYIFKYSTEQVEVERMLRHERQETEQRLAALRESLGFMAHELNTPLAAVRGSVTLLSKRLTAAEIDETGDSGHSAVTLTQKRPGEVAEALERAGRSALYCQSLVTAFVQTAREAYPGAEAQQTTASELVHRLLKDYPFERSERGIVALNVRSNFELRGRRDLIYLVLCTVLKNALQAVRERADSAIQITIELVSGDDSRGTISFQDNGGGIQPEVLDRLTHEPVTTRGTSGTGIGLLLCRRVMESIGGSVDIASVLDVGAVVRLEFDLTRSA